MDRFDYELSVAAGLGSIVVGLAAFFNILQSSLQIIGIGAALSLGLGAVRVVTERGESRRRIRNERILRLMPTVYNPLWKWAVATQRAMAGLEPDELYNPVQGPPDLTMEGDFEAIVGDTLKTAVAKNEAAYREYDKQWINMRDAYNAEVHAELTKLGLTANFEGASLIAGETRIPIMYGPYTYTLKTVRAWIAQANVYSLALPNQNFPVPCPGALLKLMQNPKELLPFGDFQHAKSELKSSVSLLVDLVRNALAKGEPDWKLMK